MKKMLFAVGVGAIIVGTSAAAQPIPPVAPVPPAQPMPPMGGRGGQMHADRTRQQAQMMADQMFRRFDVNGDGVLTRDEAQQALASAQAARSDDGQQGGGRAQRMIDRMFAGAPSVTLAQFEGQALGRFDRQDLNHDGVVTAAERSEGRGARAQ